MNLTCKWCKRQCNELGICYEPDCPGPADTALDYLRAANERLTAERDEAQAAVSGLHALIRNLRIERDVLSTAAPGYERIAKEAMDERDAALAEVSRLRGDGRGEERCVPCADGIGTGVPHTCHRPSRRAPAARKDGGARPPGAPKDGSPCSTCGDAHPDKPWAHRICGCDKAPGPHYQIAHPAPTSAPAAPPSAPHAVEEQDCPCAACVYCRSVQ